MENENNLQKDQVALKKWKIATIILSIISAICIISLIYILCNPPTVDNPQQEKIEAQDKTENNKSTQETSNYIAEWVDDGTPMVFEHGQSKAAIKDISVVESGDKLILKMDFRYKNSSSDAKNFINDYYIRPVVYQNGIELDSTGITAEKGLYNTNKSYTNIKDGAELDTQLIFVLQDTNDISVEFGWDNPTIKKIKIISNN